MSHIPTPIRAALGLAATAVAEARRLPETLPQLPVAAVSTAMQASLRLQQRIATYAARGDEVISQLRGTSAEPPAWATFDDAPADSAAGVATAAFDRAEPVNLEDTAGYLAEPGEVSAPGGIDVGEPGGAEPAHLIDTTLATSGAPAADIEGSGDSRPAAAKGGKPAPGKTPPAKVAKAPAKKAPAKKAPAKQAPAKQAAASEPAKKAAGKKAPAKKAAKQSEPLAEAARKADPAAGPNPSTMAAEILHAHQGESPTEQGER